VRAAGSRDSIRPVTAASPASTASHCPGGDPPRQPRRRRRGQSRHRRDLLPGRIGALPVQPGREVLPGQLRRRDPGQQLPGAQAAVPLLDGASRRIQRADPHLLPIPCPAAYPVHQIGASPLEMIITSQRSSSQARAAPIGICAAVSPAYSRIRV
jgi:hypothetical protein